MADKQEEKDKEYSSSIVYVQEQDEDSPLSDMLKDLPAYITRGLLYLIFLFIAITLIWASTNQIDIISTAQSVIIPEGKTSVIQPDISGIVKEIAVKEGEKVVKGQTLAVVESEKVGKIHIRSKGIGGRVFRSPKGTGGPHTIKTKAIAKSDQPPE